MLTKEQLKTMKEIQEDRKQGTKKVKKELENELKAIKTSIDEELQEQHIILFQELIIMQTISTIQEILIGMVLDESLEHKEDEDGVAAAIDILTDCLFEQSLDVQFTSLKTKLLEDKLFDDLEEDEKHG